tara:strand:+ start:1991 stop:2665 length:675 start_codon:yes stop_codon:yes gene_type:complete
MKEKRNILPLIEKETPNLNNILDLEDVESFKDLKLELKDTWTKKQQFRTETEMRFSVLNDYKHPTKASKYWQCVREQNSFLESLMSLSFDARRAEIKLQKLKKDLEKEKDPLEKELIQIDIDEKIFSIANTQLTAKDRMREIKLWSTLKKELNDGTFDTKNVNAHQLDSYHEVYKNRIGSLTPGTSQAEVFNARGQFETLERHKKEKGLLTNESKKPRFLEKEQ